MSSVAHVVIHASQFPEKVRRDLLASLHRRRVNHKFHYDSIKQTQKWLALHQAYSPSRNDADCQAIYENSFAAAAEKIESASVHVVGLGCGGGQKDTRLLKLLKARRRKVFYTPCDVSAAMVLTARQTALTVLPEENCYPLVCDLATTDDLSRAIQPTVSRCGMTSDDLQVGSTAFRLVTFFGMIPNFEPEQILPRLASLLRPQDLLLFSANLAPGKSYADGVKRIRSQYDNALTRDWLMTFLDDLGVDRRNGDLRFVVENGRLGLKRIVARFHFRCSSRIAFADGKFVFRRGQNLRLFFSYRYSPERVRKILARHKLEVWDQWIARSEEEGVFLCCKRR